MNDTQLTQWLTTVYSVYSSFTDRVKPYTAAPRREGTNEIDCK